MTNGLGYVHDHPLAVASQTSDKHWPLALLIGAGAFTAPASFLSPHVAPDALDQDGLGACVAFAGCTIWNAMEHSDWGQWKFVSGQYGTPTSGSPTGAYLAYKWLKRGTPDGSFPGDGIPDVEGSWPEALWKMAKAYGLPDKDGKLHKASAYYAANLGSLADFALIQRAIVELGPVNIATPWPGNWMTRPTGPEYRMPAPGSMVGGHSYTLAGWETYGGELYVTCLNSWGAWGSRQGIFRFPVKWLFAAPFGPQIAWKVTDIKDAPTPPPDPEVSMTLPISDPTPKLLDAAVGTQFYRVDGTTPLAKLSSGGTGIYSPFESGVNRACRISVGGVVQLGIVRTAAITNLRPVPAPDLEAAKLEARRAEWDRVKAFSVITPPARP